MANEVSHYVLSNSFRRFPVKTRGGEQQLYTGSTKRTMSLIYLYTESVQLTLPTQKSKYCITSRPRD